MTSQTNSLKREFLGEAAGTFLLVLFGCAAVATDVLFEAHKGFFRLPGSGASA